MLSSQAAVSLAAVLLLAAAPAFGAQVDPALRRAPVGARQVVIVGLSSKGADLPLPGSTSDQLFSLPDPLPLATLAPNAAAQVRVLAALQKIPGGAPRLVRGYSRLPMLALEVTSEQLEALERVPGIERLWSSPIGRPLLASSLPFSKVPDFQQRGFKGAGTTVAVADLAIRYWTGEFGTCPTDAWADAAPGCSLVAWKNFNLWPSAPDDEAANDPRTIAEAKNHGTHVAAIVHAVAPEAKLIGLNVFSLSADGTYGSPAYDVLAALDWVAEHAAEQRIVAVNLSVGWEHTDAAACNESLAFPALLELWKSGVALVTASGNEANGDWVSEPACASLALSVGAQYDTDMRSIASCEPPGAIRPGDVACLSNLSGAVDFVAPGMHVDAAGAQKSGTSMAAPHVAGAIALQQSRWLGEQGATKPPAWAREQLMMDSLSHAHDGRVFHQLSLADGPRWSVGALFPGFARESAEATLPRLPEALERHVRFAGRGGRVAGAYLHLELVHEAPQTVEVALVAPGGRTVALTLPPVGPHFNAVLGKDYFPAAYASFAGSPVDGVWKLLLSDSAGSGHGHYLSAALFLVPEGCQPQCPDQGCGDDRCGGSCGTCAAGAVCGADRSCYGCTPDCGGRACGPDDCGGSCGGCGDATWCNGLETCKESGHCVAGASRCWQALECGSLRCDEASRACLPTVTDSKSCLLDLGCHADGAANPANPCQRCDAAAPDLWTAAAGACDDGDACTTADRCEQGRCAGAAKDCSAEAGPCRTASCDSLTGECVAVGLADGASCDDGDACTTGDSCRAGVCEPGNKTCSAGCGCSGSGGQASWAPVFLLGLLRANGRRSRGRAISRSPT